MNKKLKNSEKVMRKSKTSIHKQVMNKALNKWGTNCESGKQVLNKS